MSLQLCILFLSFQVHLSEHTLRCKVWKDLLRSNEIEDIGSISDAFFPPFLSTISFVWFSILFESFLGQYPVQAVMQKSIEYLMGFSW